MDSQLLAFAGVAALLTITPGADTALVLHSSLADSPVAVRRTILGICTGLMVWGAAVAGGIAALLVASSTAFTVLKVVGAVYLVGLGALAILRSMRDPGEGSPLGLVPVPAAAARRRPYARGLATNLLNPKIAIFYTTLLPQFIGPGQSALALSMLLAATHAVLTLVWLLAVAGAATRARQAMRRPAVRRLLDRLTGVALMALGARLALQRG